jgi:hypothetical protein
MRQMATLLLLLSAMLPTPMAEAAPSAWPFDETYPDPYGKGAFFFSEVLGPPGQYKTTITNYPILTGAITYYDSNGAERWSRLSEQIFRIDKWSVCRG